MQCTQWNVVLKLARLQRPILDVCSQGFCGTHLVGCLLHINQTQDPRLDEFLGIFHLHQQKKGKGSQGSLCAFKTPYGQPDERHNKAAVEISKRSQ